METQFPDHDNQATGFRVMFMVGWRKSASKEAERTGTVILKRTYDINPKSGSLAPSINPWPVFLSDYPDNLVDNGDFETELNKTPGKPETWHFEPGTLNVTRVADPLNPGKNHVLKVSGEIGGRIVQEIDVGEPLKGQEFMLTCSAWTDGAPVSLAGLQLEAEGAIFEMPKLPEDYTKPWNLEPKKKLFSSAGQWQQTDSDKNPKKMSVVLSAGLAAGHIVFYDDVKVFNALRYEHDLSSYKPEADVIVLGYANILEGTDASISVDGKVWLKRMVKTTNRRHLFGWMPRSKDNRKKQAGFSESPNAYPLKGLPEKFDNGFFNGYQRDHKPKSFAGFFPFLRSDSEIVIERVSEAQPYRFKLPGDKVSATYSYYDLTKPDTKAYWQSQSIPMNIDTLVIEPEKNRCYIVWRGVWNFDEHAEANYRRLEVLAST